MGLSYRKGLKQGPVRIDLSKSGVGYPVGAGGERAGTKAQGRSPVSASRGGLRNAVGDEPETIPTGRIVDLTAKDGEFWVDIEVENRPGVREALAAAVRGADAAGALEPAIPVQLWSYKSGELDRSIAVLIDRNVVLGVIPSSDERFRVLATLLFLNEALGSCLALVFDEGGALGLKLAIGRQHVGDDYPDYRPAVPAEPDFWTSAAWAPERPAALGPLMTEAPKLGAWGTGSLIILGIGALLVLGVFVFVFAARFLGRT